MKNSRKTAGVSFYGEPAFAVLFFYSGKFTQDSGSGVPDQAGENVKGVRLVDPLGPFMSIFPVNPHVDGGDVQLFYSIDWHRIKSVALR